MWLLRQGSGQYDGRVRMHFFGVFLNDPGIHDHRHTARGPGRYWTTLAKSPPCSSKSAMSSLCCSVNTVKPVYLISAPPVTASTPWQKGLATSTPVFLRPPSER